MEAPIPPLLSKIETALRWCRIYQSKGEDIMASAYWDDVTRMVAIAEYVGRKIVSSFYGE